LKSHPLDFFTSEWKVSYVLHGFIALAVFGLFMNSKLILKKDLDIDVIENPKRSAEAVQITAPKTILKKEKAREVFGVNRKSLTSDQGETTKLGNTLAKNLDSLKLNPNDPDSLPIPGEDYLISKMPVLKAEVRIPYPADSKQKGIQGAVVMDILIDAFGKVRQVILVDGPAPDLNDAAVKATKSFEFSPAYIQHNPVAVRIRYAYRFVLEH
jgi:TonB family protein